MLRSIDDAAADALLWTDSALVRRSPRGALRLLRADANIDLKLANVSGKSGLQGLVIVKHRSAPPDTLYNDLSTQQFTTLVGVLKELDPAEDLSTRK